MFVGAVDLENTEVQIQIGDAKEVKDLVPKKVTQNYCFKVNDLDKGKVGLEKKMVNLKTRKHPFK